MTKKLAVPEHEYLRTYKKFPSVWCAGCGIGIVLGAIIRAVSALGLSKDAVAMVSGIGCTGRMPVYVDFSTMHTTHGRALAFATGLKLARPELEVLVIMGDGDALAIGGNHFIHAARRNIELTTIVVNNSIMRQNFLDLHAVMRTVMRDKGYPRCPPSRHSCSAYL